MANTKVKNICLICKKSLNEGKGYFISMVELTKKGRTGSGDGGASWGGSWQDVPEGKLRIKYLSSGKPRGAVHTDCLKEKLGIK